MKTENAFSSQQKPHKNSDYSPPPPPLLQCIDVILHFRFSDAKSTFSTFSKFRKHESDVDERFTSQREVTEIEQIVEIVST